MVPKMRLQVFVIWISKTQDEAASILKNSKIEQGGRLSLSNAGANG